MVNITHRPLYPWDRSPVHSEYEARYGEFQLGRFGEEGSLIPCRDSNPGSSSPSPVASPTTLSRRSTWEREGIISLKGVLCSLLRPPACTAVCIGVAIVCLVLRCGAGFVILKCMYELFHYPGLLTWSAICVGVPCTFTHTSS